MQGNGNSAHVHRNRWMSSEMARNGLSIRRKTTESQKDSEKLIDKLISYVLQVRRLREKFSYRDSDIIAVDEATVWQDMLSNTTVDSIGKNTYDNHENNWP